MDGDLSANADGASPTMCDSSGEAIGDVLSEWSAAESSCGSAGGA